MSGLERLTQAAKNALDHDITPAIVAAAAHPARGLRWSFVGGAATVIPTRQPVAEQTLFDLASLTKVLVTGWLCMDLHSRGELDLDAPLGELLPNYYPDNTRQLSLRQLLAHCAGLPSGLRLRQQYPPSACGAQDRRRQIVDRFLQVPIEAEPGVRTLYSDIGPVVIGDLLEQMTDDRIDRLATERVLSPAGMTTATYRPLDNPAISVDDVAATEVCPWRKELVRGVVHDENAFLMDGVAGHAGLFAALSDLETAARCFLEQRGPGMSSLAEFRRPQHLVPGSTRALGWDTAHADGPSGQRLSPEAFGHTGFTGTSIWIDPRLGLYIIVLTNRVHPSRSNQAFLDWRPQFHDLVMQVLRDE